jgi:hypothetical protein
VDWGVSGLLLIGRNQTCSIGNFTVGYFTFHAETNKLSAHLKVLGSVGESSEVQGELSEVQGKSAASEAEGQLGSEVKGGPSSEVDGMSSEVDGKLSEIDGKPSEVDGESSIEGETCLGG